MSLKTNDAESRPLCLARQSLQPEGEDIEQSDLLDFDVAVTLHRDQSSSFGLGIGFFKANMIR